MLDFERNKDHISEQGTEDIFRLGNSFLKGHPFEVTKEGMLDWEGSKDNK